MKEIRVTSLTNESVVIDEETFNSFKSKLRGEVYLPGDSSYDNERKIWNGMIDKKPGLIVCCRGTSDVIHSINFARKYNLLSSIRGGGHNVAGNAVCHGGMMISLYHMKGIILDPVNKEVIVQPGVSWGDVDKETQIFGLAAPGGIVSTTGVSGLILGGGFGWLSRKFGFSSDNLIAADVVTADGKFLTASESENKELFWGIKGGGGNFGVITAYKLKLQPVGPQVVAGLILYHLKDAVEVTNFFREFTKNSPDNLTSLLVLRLAPPAPFLPANLHGKPVIGIAVCHVGDIEEGKKLVEPLKKFGNPIADLIAVKPFIAHQSMFDGGQLSGNNYYWKSEYLSEISNEMIIKLSDYTNNMTSPLSAILIFQLGGKIKRSSEIESSAGNRDADFIVNINGCWVNAEDSSKNIQWVKDVWNSVLPYAKGGVYVNFLSDDEGEERVKAAYKENYKKMISLKNKYDPDNFFRLNQNIKPVKDKEEVI